MKKLTLTDLANRISPAERIARDEMIRRMSVLQETCAAMSRAGTIPPWSRLYVPSEEEEAEMLAQFRQEFMKGGGI